MFLHLGKDIIIPDKSVIGIFDLDTSTTSRHTRAFLHAAEADGNVINVSQELPKSAVLAREDNRMVIYLSQISTQTLFKRSQSESVAGQSDILI